MTTPLRMQQPPSRGVLRTLLGLAVALVLSACSGEIGGDAGTFDPERCEALGESPEDPFAAGLTPDQVEECLIYREFGMAGVRDLQRDRAGAKAPEGTPQRLMQDAEPPGSQGPDPDGR